MGRARLQSCDSRVTEDHETSLIRLLTTLQMQDIQMFAKDELIRLAYERQGARIAFSRSLEGESAKRESA